MMERGTQVSSLTPQGAPSQNTGEVRHEPSVPGPTLGEAIHLFQLAGSTAGKRPATLRSYAYILGSLARFLEDVSTQAICAHDLRAYLEHLQQRRRITPATLSCHIRALRAFFSWLVREGVLRANPALALQKPRLPKIYPYVMTPEQVRALLTACDLQTLGGRRAWAFILLLFGTGLRLSEALAVRLEDINFGLGQILVREGKGGKPRVVPLDTTLVAALGHYHRGREVDSPWLFCSATGRQLTGRRIHRILQQLGKRARLVGVRVSPHTFRHSFATAFLDQGGNLEALRQMLGHSSLAVTSTYLHLSTAGLREAVERCSPLRGLGLSLDTRRGKGGI